MYAHASDYELEKIDNLTSISKPRSKAGDAINRILNTSGDKCMTGSKKVTPQNVIAKCPLEASRYYIRYRRMLFKTMITVDRYKFTVLYSGILLSVDDFLNAHVQTSLIMFQDDLYDLLICIFCTHHSLKL